MFGVPETSEFTKPPGFVRILWLSFRKNQGNILEVRFDFGPRPGFSKQLFGSSREGTELDRMFFKKFLIEPLWGGRLWLEKVCIQENARKQKNMKASKP